MTKFKSLVIPNKFLQFIALMNVALKKFKGSFGMEKRNEMKSRNDIWRVRNGT